MDIPKEQPKELLKFPCPVCNSTKYKVLYPDTLQGRTPMFTYDFTKNYNLTFRMVKCLDCTHVYASPRPASIWSYYTEDKVDEIYMQNETQRVATSDVVVKYLLKYKPSGKLLDVGCATGDFILSAKKHYDAEGLELSEWSSKMAERRGIKIHRKLLDMMKTPEEYDIVTRWGVIEHFEYPKNEIENIRRILKPGGIVALWTGDISSIIAFMMGKKWWYYQGQHIEMFTNKSMKILFESCGFEKLYMGYYPYVITHHSLCNTLSLYPALLKIYKFMFPEKIFGGTWFKLKLPGEMFAIFVKK